MPEVKQAVYQLKHRGVYFYRLGTSAKEARKRLAKELKVNEKEIQILDEGKPQ